MKRLAVVISSVVVFAVVVFYLKTRPPQRDGEQPPVSSAVIEATHEGAIPAIHERRFASIDEYLAAGSSSQHKVVFIGLDGASWEIINPMVLDGGLPTFKRLKEEGTSGLLRSTPCYFSPPAWTSMMTGFVPEKTGVYTFGKWIPDKKDFESISVLDVEVPYVWDVASSAGKRVAVTNVPATYPARELNGIQVSGLMTPIIYATPSNTWVPNFRRYRGAFVPELDAKSRGSTVMARFVFSVNTFVIALYDTTRDRNFAYDAIALKVFPTAGDWDVSDDVPVVRLSFDKPSPWFQIDYRKKTGDRRETKKVYCSLIMERMSIKQGYGRLRITPLLRPATDPDLSMTYPDSVALSIERDLGGYFTSLGACDPAFLPAGTNDAARFADYFYGYDDWDLFFYVFQTPDNIQHQEGVSDRSLEVYKNIDRFLGDLIDRLPEDVTLVLASDHGFAKYEYLIDLNFFFDKIGVLENSQDPDFDKTLVFHNRWCLYFNDDLLTVPELTRRDIPIADGQTPRDALVAYLRYQCAQIYDQTTGQKMPVRLIDVPQDGAGLPPDMIVNGAYTNYFVEGNDLGIKAGRIVRPATDREQWYHSRDGMYLFWGDRVKAGARGRVRDVQDITPTILFLMDLPLSGDFDGVVMEDVFRSEYLATASKSYINRYDDVAPDVELTTEELESLSEKLKSLGYIR